MADRAIKLQNIGKQRVLLLVNVVNLFEALKLPDGTKNSREAIEREESTRFSTSAFFSNNQQRLDTRFTYTFPQTFRNFIVIIPNISENCFECTFSKKLSLGDPKIFCLAYVSSFLMTIIQNLKNFKFVMFDSVSLLL